MPDRDLRGPSGSRSGRPARRTASAFFSRSRERAHQSTPAFTRSAVTKRFAMPIGSRTFQPSPMSWSYRNRGVVHRTQMNSQQKNSVLSESVRISRTAAPIAPPSAESAPDHVDQHDERRQRRPEAEQEREHERPRASGRRVHRMPVLLVPEEELHARRDAADRDEPEQDPQDRRRRAPAWRATRATPTGSASRRRTASRSRGTARRCSRTRP